MLRSCAATRSAKLRPKHKKKRYDSATGIAFFFLTYTPRLHRKSASKMKCVHACNAWQLLQMLTHRSKNCAYPNSKQN